MRLKENWHRWTTEQSKDFLRAGPEGKTQPSRAKTLSLLDGVSSVLDVGCGTGVMFELIRDLGLNIDYLGIDVTENFLEVAKSLYPEDRHRFRRMSLYETKKLRRKFDAVICRHVLDIYRTIFQPFSFYIPVQPKSLSLFSICLLDPLVQNGNLTNTISEDFIRIPMI